MWPRTLFPEGELLDWFAAFQVSWAPPVIREDRVPGVWAESASAEAASLGIHVGPAATAAPPSLWDAAQPLQHSGTSQGPLQPEGRQNRFQLQSTPRRP